MMFAKLLLWSYLGLSLLAPGWGKLGETLAGRLLAGTTIQVTTTADDLTDNGNCSLREAIQAANTAAAVDACPAGSSPITIQIPAGFYQLTLAGPYENANATGDLDLTGSGQITLTGAGQDATILDGSRADRVFDIPTVTPVVRITDLTIQNGVVGLTTPETQEPAVGNGGGIRHLGGYLLQVERVRFKDNLVDEPVRGNGAGIFNFGPLEVLDSEFDHNEAAYDAGGIYASGPLTVRRSAFSNNYGYGSADIRFDASGQTRRIENSDFAFGLCGPGGGGVIGLAAGALELIDSIIEYPNCDVETIYNFGNLTLTHVQIWGGKGAEGVINHHSGRLVVRRSVIGQSGGSGMITITGGEARIEQTALVKNSGPGLLVQGGSTRLENSTLAASTGGVVVEAGSLTIESSTLTNNQDDSGGLRVTGGQVTLHNTLIAYNREASGKPHDCAVAADTTLSAGYNLVGVSDSCGITPTAGDLFGALLSPLDPRLGPLTDGPRPTQPPLPGSPAIDRADPNRCPSVDQRAVSRPQGPRCDIGAHEVEKSAIVLQTIYLPVTMR